MNETEIRLATIQDVPEVQRLLKELAAALGKSEEIKGTEQDLERHGFGGQPRFEAMLALVGDEAVGLAVFFYEYSTWRGSPGVYVQDLYVASQARGTGLGRQLLRAVRERARAWGGRYVKLTVYDGNQAAISFYRHLGFELCDDEQALVLRD
jgi:GNAT superfamily N-acetyltransferase